MVVDGFTHTGHTRGVDPGQVTAVVDRGARRDLDLATHVGQEGGVTDVVNRHALQGLEGLNQLAAVLGVAGVRGQVDDEGVTVSVSDVDAVDDRTGRRGGVHQGRHRLL